MENIKGKAARIVIDTIEFDTPQLQLFTEAFMKFYMDFQQTFVSCYFIIKPEKEKTKEY